MQHSSQAVKSNNQEIAAIVARLLNHYWVPDLPSEVWQAQFEDWLYDLGEFTPALVADACTRFRRQPGNRRPVPGDIRTFCVEMRHESREHQLAITDRRDQWPEWLAQQYGPLPKGPHIRAEGIVGHGKWLRLGRALSAERRLWYVSYYLHSAEWKALRSRVFARCKGICERCNNAGAHDVHHLTYDRIGSELLTDLLGVCRVCHEELHPPSKRRK